MRDKGARRKNVLWKDCKKEEAKRMNSNRGHRWALCAFLIAFIFAFLFAAIPVSAHSNIHKAESNHQFTLEIYGNANEDDTIDMRDVTYIKLVIFGKKPETEFCDANYDGRVSMLDVVQTKLIIVGKEAKLTLLDDYITENYPDGKPVTINKPVERMIVLSTYATEAVRTLKSMDKIVGVPTYTVTQHALFFPELVGLPTIGSGFKPDIEKVIELEPDIVLAYAESPKPEEFDDKLPESIKVVHLDFSRADLMIEDFAKLGYILDKEDDAKEIIDFYEEFNSKINERTAGLSDDEKPKVYLESIWELDSKYKAIGKGTGPDAACAMAGGINIADFDGYKTVDPEWVIKQNPDIIIAVVFTGVGCGYEHDDPSALEAVRESIMNRPELAEVPAVKEGKVYCIAIQVTSKPRYFVGVAYMAKWFHPELFEDLDPRALNEEYLNKYQGMPYRGVYAYPEPS